MFSTLDSLSHYQEELSGLIGNEAATASSAVPVPSTAPAVEVDRAMISRLRGLQAVYEKMLVASRNEGNLAKQRRCA